MELTFKEYLLIRRIHQKDGKLYDCMSDHEVEISLETLKSQFEKRNKL